MENRYSVHPEQVKRFTTEEPSQSFLNGSFIYRKQTYDVLLT